jgi:hypothetical protein
MDAITFYLKAMCVIHTIGLFYSLYHKKMDETLWGFFFLIWPLYLLWKDKI